jgi:hypothetical protein
LGSKLRKDRSSGLKVIDIKKIQDGCHPAATILDYKMSSAGNIPCGSEVVHQISKGSVEWFKSYRDLKNPSWPRPPSWICENLNIAGESPCGSEVGHQILKGSDKRFNSYRYLKDPRWPPASAGLRPPSWILAKSENRKSNPLMK